MVVAWHFTHARDGFPVPFDYVPIVPLAVFDEGHTGVSLFMTLSGYLFARLLAGKSIHYGAFIWNRALRLLPLLLVVIAAVAALIVRGGGDRLFSSVQRASCCQRCPTVAGRSRSSFTSICCCP
jgi:peptidoglycan/LPS O-acetylase OafA/YrhL